MHSWQLVIIFTAVLCLDQVTSDFTFETQVHIYRNPTSAANADGRCCDSQVDRPPSCRSECDNMFILCFREFGNTNRNLSSVDCPQGRIETGLIRSNDDDLIFTAGASLSGISNPLIATGARWPGSIQLAIQAWDYDMEDPADIIDIFFIDVVMSNTNSPSFSDRMTFTGIYNNGNFEMSFRLSCTENYYGQDCTTFCIERDSDLGHYTCGSDGRFVCREGYEEPSTNCTRCVSTICGSSGAIPLTTVIGVAGGVGGLLLLVIVILIGIIAVIVGRKKKTTIYAEAAKNQRSTVYAVPIPTSRNLAYGNGETTGIQSQIHPPDGVNNMEEEEYQSII